MKEYKISVYKIEAEKFRNFENEKDARMFASELRKQIANQAGITDVVEMLDNYWFETEEWVEEEEEE